MAKPPMRLRKYDEILGTGRERIPGWTCPKCGKQKPIEGFGFRYKADEKAFRIQSYCRTCR